MKSCACCGAELHPGNAGGSCVRCLLEGGLDSPCVGVTGQSAGLGNRGPATIHFGDYELLEEVARGGMGVVYRARQSSLNRIVALKMILGGKFASKQVVQRFRGEVSAAALLHHPNIVAIHDVGIHDDQHYFSMDYVEGQNLSQLVGIRPLPSAAAARYVKIVAEAIHYAHSRGILHRDLKPSNVLIDSATDQPRVTDFGLAKRLDGESSITVTGQLLGSPNFMPPEQAGSKHGNVGRHSDVYGLGAILYYLLTARAPFQAESLERVCAQVVNEEPIAPRTLEGTIPRDLETICLKCLSKEAPKRYATARDFAAELDCFINNRPIRSRPVSAIERGWRWCKRKPALAFLGMSLVLVFAFGFIGTFWQWRHALRNAEAETVQRQIAQVNGERLNQHLYDADMSLAQHSFDDGDLGGTLKLLEAHRPLANETDRRGFEWFYFRNLCAGAQDIVLTNHSQAVTSVTLSSDGKRLATCSSGSPVQVWNTATGELLKTLPDSHALTLAFADGGRTVAVGGRDQVSVWDLETKRAIFKHEEPFGRFQVAISSVGTLIAFGKGSEFFPAKHGGAQLWDYASQELKKAFPESSGHIALSLGGDRLATGTWRDTTRIWDVHTLEMIGELPTGWAIALALSPDGKRLATSDWEGAVKIWDIATHQQIGSLTKTQTRVYTLAFSPDGKLLAAGGTAQVIQLWDTVTFQEVQKLKGHGSEVVCVVFSSDSRKLASGSKDASARIWSVLPAGFANTISHVRSRPVLSANGRWAAAGSGDNKVTAWDLATGEVQAVFDEAQEPVAFSRDSRTLVTRGTNYFLRIFDVESQGVIQTIPGAPAPFPYYASLSPDGLILATGDTNGTLTFFDAATGKVRTSIPHVYVTDFFQLEFSPDGRCLASAGRLAEPDRDTPAAKIWDVATGTQLGVSLTHADLVISVAYSPDGKILATCGVDDVVKLWDTSSWKQVLPAIGQKEILTAVAFSPDGKTLATACSDGRMKLWSVATHRELASLDVGIYGFRIAFAPDGQTLVGLGSEMLRLWRAPRNEFRPAKNNQLKSVRNISPKEL